MGSFMDAAGGVMSIAQDIIGLMKTGIETIGLVKQSMDILVRGIENTEQINVFIDTIQKFIEMAAKVAQTVSDITGFIGGFTGKMDFGATAAASAIAGMISGILTTVNAAIDMAQEAWHLFGSYFGQFLGFLAGAGDQIEGDTRFLLDQNDKTLKAYGRNTPQDKASHPYGQEVGGFLSNDRNQQQPQIGSITVFGGPNQDPRDTTRNMMFAVKTATMGSTYAQ
jgi:phage-related protein